MTRDEFLGSMRRLADYFAGKPYSQDQLKSVWNAVHAIRSQDFDRVIDDMSLNLNRAPPAGQVIARCRPLLRKVNDERHVQEIRALEASAGKCRACFGLGVLYALERTPQKHRATFRCSFCRAAEIRGISPQLTLWREEYGGAFEIETVEVMERELRAMPDWNAATRGKAGAGGLQPIGAYVARATKEILR